MDVELLVRPARYRPFGSADGTAFCLVTNSTLLGRFRIEETGAYTRSLSVPFDQGDVFEDLLERLIPEPAHVLVISPNAFFRSPAPESIGRRKLMVMACSSTLTPLAAIAHFLEVIERTDPEDQQELADRFFTLGESSEHLRFVDRVQGAHAIFGHLSDHYDWNQQAGLIGWGEQQIAPAGELSVLPAEILRFDDTLRLAIHGEITFRGHSVLHSGALPCREDQARIHRALAGLSAHAVVATAQDGIISRLRATHPEAQPAVDILEEMFAADSRYRIIWEIGFGINKALTSPLPGNHAMNEVFGGTSGAVHWGLGLTPYTRYALILSSLDTRVLDASGAVVLGAGDSPQKPRMKRRSVSGCICHS